MAIPTSKEARKDPPRLRSRTTRRGSSGWAARCSMSTKATRSTAAAAKRVTVVEEPQPSVPALVKP